MKLQGTLQIGSDEILGGEEVATYREPAGADQHQHSFLGGKGLGSNKERV